MMRHKAILQGIGALAVALALVVGLTGAAYAQADDVIEEPGVLITGVVAESPAAAAGLVRGDIILAVNGTPVNNAQELADAVQDTDPGETVELTLRHGDEESTIPVAVAERDGRSFLGVRPYNEDVLMPAMPMEITPLAPISGTEPVSETAPSTLTLEKPEPALPAGAVVVAVLPGSPAEAAGLQPGDVIVAVDGSPVADAADLVAAVAGYAPDAQVVLDVVRVGEVDPQPVAVILAGRPDDEDQAYLGVSVAPSPSDAELWDDQDAPDEWDEPDETWECPMHDGGDHPHRGRWHGPMMRYSEHSHGHMGWNGSMTMPYGQGPHMPMRIPYPGQGWRR